MYFCIKLSIMATDTFNQIPSTVASATKVTVPASANSSGTIVTNGLGVTGTLTKFLTELPLCSWIYNSSTNELRRVTQVMSDTYAILEEKFSSEISGTAPAIINAKDAKAKQYTFTALSVAGKLYDNTGTAITSLPVNIPIVRSKLGNGRSSRADLLSPVIIEAGSGGSIDVDIVY